MVTGGAGFIGSHLVDALVEDGHTVVVVDNLSRGKIKNIQNHLEHDRITFLRGDIRDYAFMEKACSGCGVVFHLAAQSNVIGAVTNIDYSFETNVTGTFNVLKSARETGVQRLIFTSSREAYGEAAYIPVDEDHPLRAKNVYGASKVAGEAYCMVFKGMGITELSIFRLANVYGPRDYDRVIPIFLNNIREGQPLTVYGGRQVIDFIPVGFVVDVFRKMVSARVTCDGPVNIGSGKGLTLFELIERLEHALKMKAETRILEARDVEVSKFIADVTRFRESFSMDPPDDPLCGLDDMSDITD